MASIIKVDRILDSTELGAVEIPIGIDTGTMNATEMVSDTWKSQDGTENYKCKCWVNFDGTTTPPTIRESGNVSSVTRTATGDYTINFTTAVEDINYGWALSVGKIGIGSLIEKNGSTPHSTSSFSVRTTNLATGGGASSTNQLHVSVAIFR